MTNWLSTLLRTTVMFFITFSSIRVMGKNNLSKLTAFKLVTYIVIAIISALISLDLVGSTVFPFIALLVWITLTIAIDYLCIKSKWIHDFVNGSETILVQGGKVMEDNLMKVKYTGEELLKELRSKNAFSLADVEFAVMESTGDINVLLKPDKTPITPHDLKLKVSPTCEPVTVILDGNIFDEALAQRKLNRQWLEVQLSNLGVSLDNVFIGQIDSYGDLYIDLFDDLIKVQQPQVKELLYASIQKVHSDLLSHSLETNDASAKKMYNDNANKIKAMMDTLEPYLLR